MFPIIKITDAEGCFYPSSTTSTAWQQGTAAMANHVSAGGNARLDHFNFPGVDNRVLLGLPIRRVPVLVATRNISEGEEIVYDYGSYADPSIRSSDGKRKRSSSTIAQASMKLAKHHHNLGPGKQDFYFNFPKDKSRTRRGGQVTSAKASTRTPKTIAVPQAAATPAPPPLSSHLWCPPDSSYVKATLKVQWPFSILLALGLKDIENR